jgi:hypothetical protein
MDFKYTLLTYQPYISKPIITKKLAKEKGLSIEDVSFIYENPDEYELDDELLIEVENWRKNKYLPINKNYKYQVKNVLIENKRDD